MPEKHLYEYAIIRLVPNIEREEFINIGLIMFSKQEKYINMRYIIDKEKLNLFLCELDVSTLEKTLVALQKVCLGMNDAGKIALLDIPERFRWITAMRSTSLQTSRPHTGLSFNLDHTFEKLYSELVL